MVAMKPVTPQKISEPAIMATRRKVGECLDMVMVWLKLLVEMSKLIYLLSVVLQIIIGDIP
jgi:hypothetical protein